jgi:hypothetical protein
VKHTIDKGFCQICPARLEFKDSSNTLQSVLECQ